MKDRYISQTEVMRAISEEYKRKAERGSGLKLAWIEKAINSVKGWTYCADNEHNPEEYGEYLITWTGYVGNMAAGPFLEIAEWDDDWLVDHIEERNYNNVMVQAWMPLPDPYGTDEDEYPGMPGQFDNMTGSMNLH